jgi:predicted benzoate:H+ symporter BenE
VVPAVAVLIVAGFHVPLIPLLEAAGSVGAVAPTQSGPIAVNTGVTCAAIVISIDAGLAH